MHAVAVSDESQPWYVLETTGTGAVDPSEQSHAHQVGPIDVVSSHLTPPRERASATEAAQK